jgi:hypothetical protein
LRCGRPKKLKVKRVNSGTQAPAGPGNSATVPTAHASRRDPAATAPTSPSSTPPGLTPLRATQPLAACAWRSHAALQTCLMATEPPCRALMVFVLMRAAPSCSKSWTREFAAPQKHQGYAKCACMAQAHACPARCSHADMDECADSVIGWLVSWHAPYVPLVQKHSCPCQSNRQWCCGDKK